MAVLSHLPQALASLLAGRLVDVPPDWLELAGQGFRDMTRIADSDPGLWSEIASGNADQLVQELRQMGSGLTALADQLAIGPDGVGESFGAVVQSGNAGRGRLPGKHGARRQPYVPVPVVVADEPGVLARLLTDAGAAGINVEDLSLEHSPGAQVGLCELLVRPEQVSELQRVLRERGWSVHATPALESRETDSSTNS
jgi:prephenate dehydrogenase